eukprot:scaffold20268_cov111-Isochrysis_galbana.AAC.5
MGYAGDAGRGRRQRSQYQEGRQVCAEEDKGGRREWHRHCDHVGDRVGYARLETVATRVGIEARVYRRRVPDGRRMAQAVLENPLDGC